MTIKISPIAVLTADELRRLISGYTSHATYRVHKHETGEQTTITLVLMPLAEPFHKDFAEDLDAHTIAHYLELPAKGFSFGAYDGERLVGIALAEAQQWNLSLWVWELHVAPAYRQRGIGRSLLDAVAALGRQAGLRAIVCETQNTNVPAIHFYRRAGFTLQGIDLSYYTNSDYPGGEIAIFMKRKI